MQQETQILRVTREDIPAIGEMLYETKLSLSINRLLWKNWPNEAAQREHYTSTVAGAFEDPEMENFKIVDTETQVIQGYMIMTKNQASGDSAAQQGQSTPKIPDIFNPEVYLSVMAEAKKVEAEWKGMDRYEVVFIVVRRSDRGKGLGSKLMQVSLDRAREADLPVVLCAEPQASTFYQKLGFKDQMHVDLDLAQFAPPFSGYGMFRLTGMIRHPETSGA